MSGDLASREFAQPRKVARLQDQSIHLTPLSTLITSFFWKKKKTFTQKIKFPFSIIMTSYTHTTKYPNMLMI